MDAATALNPAASAAMALAPGAASGASVAAARQAAQSFESFFLSQSFETMSEGLGSDELFGGGEGESIYRSMMMQEFAKSAAQSGGVGIADAVQREILQHQEVK